MINLIKKIIARYKATTPDDWQAYGTALLVLSHVVAGFELKNHQDIIAGVVELIGWLIKFCTKMAVKKGGNENVKVDP